MASSVKYAYTITLRSQLYKLNPEDQYDKTYLHIASLLKGLICTVDLVAELTRSCNIHYHGIIQFNNINSKQNLQLMFRNIFRSDKYVGFVDIKQITDEEGWLNYIIKDIPSTRNSINRPPLILNEFNDIPYDEFELQFELINEQ